NPKTKERPKEAPAETCLTGRQAGERSFPDLILKGISGFLSVFFPLFTPLTLIQAFQIARTKKVSGLQPDDLKNHSFHPKYQPSCSEGKPERLEENPFPTVDDAPMTLQHTDAFNELTTLPIGLMPPSILTPDEGVKTPSTADVWTTCLDAQLLAVPARLLATFGRMVDVEVFSIKNFNLLITNTFCLKRVDKNKDEGKIIFSDYQFLTDIGGLDHHERCADKMGKDNLVLSFFIW
ncbi:MAG: hypothetical protein JXB49_28405, partial [Bacteroidales bacterium]|nr:hypothetical protein [Bacteroidales bacterium]